MKQEIYQKQFSLGEILSESWKRFTENFQLILSITLIIYIPINILLSLTLLEGLSGDFELYSKVSNMLGRSIGVIATMAIAFVIQNKIDGKTIGIGDAFKKSFSRWGAVIGTGIILAIFLFGLTLLFIIPGAIFSIYWKFAPLVVILNGKFGIDALRYSKQIVKGRWWTVAWYSFVFFVLMSIVVGILGGILYLFFPKDFLISVLMGTLINILLSFFTVVSTIFFINFDATKKVDDVALTSK